jgi:hypothetical protein
MNNSNAQPNTDFWLKVSQVPPELIRSVFSKYYNATVTSVPLSIGTSTVQVPAFDRMPSNMKVCVSCKTEFEDKTDSEKKCPMCGSPVGWRDWDPPMTSLGINALLSTYLEYVNSNTTSGNIRFPDSKKGFFSSAKMTEDEFVRMWAAFIASNFIEELFVNKKQWLTTPAERLTNPFVTSIWQTLATNIYNALNKGNRAKLMDSSTETRSISESRMQVSTQRADEETENPIKNFISKM